MDFPNLKILILDGNQISSLYDLPYLFALENLSINNNKLKNVNEFSNEILEKCPKIKTINTLNNPMNPGFGNEGYIQYKNTLKKIRTLELIDGMDIKGEVNVQQYNESISSQKKNLFNYQTTKNPSNDNNLNNNNNFNNNNNTNYNNTGNQDLFGNRHSTQPKRDLFGNNSNQPKRDLFGNRNSTQPKRDLFGNNNNNTHQKVSMFGDTNSNNNNNQSQQKVSMFGDTNSNNNNNQSQQKVSMFGNTNSNNNNNTQQKVSMFGNTNSNNNNNQSQEKVSMFGDLKKNNNEINVNSSLNNNNSNFQKQVFNIDFSEQIDGSDFVKKLKKKSTIMVNMKILQKSDNMTKFNRKNRSEGNKHILNSHL